MKKRVLITGADGTLGREFMYQLDSLGYYCIPTTAKEVDLSKKGFAEKLFKKTGPVDILINNAGVGHFNGFFDDTMDDQMLKVNMIAIVELTRIYGREMVNQKAGKILNVSSMAAFCPTKGASVYSATKAFVLNFSQALHEEFKPYGVTVSALCPGAFKSNMRPSHGKPMDVKTVARNGIEGMLAGKKVIFCDYRNPLRELRARMMGKW